MRALKITPEGVHAVGVGTRLRLRLCIRRRRSGNSFGSQKFTCTFQSLSVSGGCTPLYAKYRSLKYLSAAAVTAGLALASESCRRAHTDEPAGDIARPSALFSAALTDQDGRTLTLADFREKTLIFSFFFSSCPSVCPKETQQLAEVQRRLAPDLRQRVQFVSLSVDPENDTPVALHRFAIANGASLSDWSFVRAGEPSTRRATKELAAFDAAGSGQPTPGAHTTAVYLFDGNGRLMQRYAGSPLDVPRLAREIEQLDVWFRKKKDT